MGVQRNTGKLQGRGDWEEPPTKKANGELLDHQRKRKVCARPMVMIPWTGAVCDHFPIAAIFSALCLCSFSCMQLVSFTWMPTVGSSSASVPGVMMQTPGIANHIPLVVPSVYMGVASAPPPTKVLLASLSATLAICATRAPAFSQLKSRLSRSKGVGAALAVSTT